MKGLQLHNKNTGRNGYPANLLKEDEKNLWSTGSWVVAHPEDVEVIRLFKDKSNRSLFGGKVVRFIEEARHAVNETDNPQIKIGIRFYFTAESDQKGHMWLGNRRAEKAYFEL